ARRAIKFNQPKGRSKPIEANLYTLCQPLFPFAGLERRIDPRKRTHEIASRKRNHAVCAFRNERRSYAACPSVPRQTVTRLPSPIGKTADWKPEPSAPPPSCCHHHDSQ